VVTIKTADYNGRMAAGQSPWARA